LTTNYFFHFVITHQFLDEIAAILGQELLRRGLDPFSTNPEVSFYSLKMAHLLARYVADAGVKSGGVADNALVPWWTTEIVNRFHHP
jgi:hypothetical protein